MRAVLDEGVPRQLIPLLARAGCRVEPFPKNRRGLENGQLAAQLAADGFECLVTCDKNFEHQQNLKALGLALVVLPAQRLAELARWVPEIAAAISNAKTGVVVKVARETRPPGKL